MAPPVVEHYGGVEKRVSVWTRMARRRREALLTKLGGECVQCKSKTDLTFDHPKGIQWDASAMSSHQRLKRYEQEASQGLLQILCAPCNKKKGRPEYPEPEEGEPF